MTDTLARRLAALEAATAAQQRRLERALARSRQVLAATRRVLTPREPQRAGNRS